MPPTSADGVHLEWRVRVPQRYCPIGVKTLEGHLISHKDTAIPRHIEQISQFCPHRIAEFIKFLRDIHVVDQISKQHTKRCAPTETYVSPPFGFVVEGAFACLLTGWAEACGVAQALITGKRVIGYQ